MKSSVVAQAPYSVSPYTSKLCDIADWNDPRFTTIASAIMDPSQSLAPKHRKLWEFTRLVQALTHHGLLAPLACGLSVAAGHERVLYYLSNYIGRLVATDIYGEGSFQKGEATAEILRNAESMAPYSYQKDRLSFLYMNGLQLTFPNHLFDFAFSLSSIEHFGGVAAASRAIAEMARVVRPGGLVVVATDCVLRGFPMNEVFSKHEITRLCTASPELELCTPINWSISDESKKYVLNMRGDNLSQTPHINLRSYATIFTSIALVLRKKGPALPPSQQSYDEVTSYLERRVERPAQMQNQKTSPPSRFLEQFKARERGLRYRLQEWLFPPHF